MPSSALSERFVASCPCPLWGTLSTVSECLAHCGRLVQAREKAENERQAYLQSYASMPWETTSSSEQDADIAMQQIGYSVVLPRVRVEDKADVVESREAEVQRRCMRPCRHASQQLVEGCLTPCVSAVVGAQGRDGRPAHCSHTAARERAAAGGPEHHRTGCCGGVSAGVASESTPRDTTLCYCVPNGRGCAAVAMLSLSRWSAPAAGFQIWVCEHERDAREEAAEFGGDND